MEGIMKGIKAAGLACGMILAAAGARAERFADVKYLSGVKGVGPRTGVLVVESGLVRFEDRKGRPVFSGPLAGAGSWVGSEKRTSLGRVLGNVALLPVLVPLSGGYGNPWVGGTRQDRPIVMLRAGTDPAPLYRLRVSDRRIQEIVDAVNRAARAASGEPSGDALAEARTGETPLPR